MLIERLALGRDRLDGFDLLRSREEDVLPGAVASGARLGLGLGHHDDLQRQQVPVNVQAHQAATGGTDYFSSFRLFHRVQLREVAGSGLFYMAKYQPVVGTSCLDRSLNPKYQPIPT